MENSTVLNKFYQAVRCEVKQNSEIYDSEYYTPQGFWSPGYTALRHPFFVPSDRQTEPARTTPQSLWKDLWHEGEVCCLFGEPNVGKSVLANMIAYDIASQEIPVLYIDFENSPHQACLRYDSPMPGAEKKLHAPLDIHFVTVNPQLSYRQTRDFNTVLDAIEHEFVSKETPVVIIDDISHICPMRECSVSQDVMRRLRQWTIKYSVSILIVAHATKHRPETPITLNSLFGASHMAYSFDSIFALGRAFSDPSIRYIKQLKSRVTAIQHDAHNLIAMKFAKGYGELLLFNIIGAGFSEDRLLDIPMPADRQAEALKLTARGWSTRQIAARLAVSQPTVINILKRALQDDKSDKNDKSDKCDKIDNNDNNDNNETPEKAATFRQAIHNLSQSASMPSLERELMSPHLPFSEWKDNDDPAINQYCLMFDKNPLFRYLDKVTSTYLLNTLPSVSLHIYNYDENDSAIRYGNIVYSPCRNTLGRCNGNAIDWFKSDNTPATSPQVTPSPTSLTCDHIEEKLIQAARILKHKDPAIPWPQAFATAAQATHLPPQWLTSTFLTQP